MSETLFALEQETPTVGAVTEIERVRFTFIEDRDKLRAALAAGGTYLEMRAAVDAYMVIEETIRGLDFAVERAKGTGDE